MAEKVIEFDGPEPKGPFMDKKVKGKGIEQIKSWFESKSAWREYGGNYTKDGYGNYLERYVTYVSGPIMVALEFVGGKVSVHTHDGKTLVAFNRTMVKSPEMLYEVLGELLEMVAAASIQEGV